MANSRKPGPIGTDGCAPSFGVTFTKGLSQLPGPCGCHTPGADRHVPSGTLTGTNRGQTGSALATPARPAKRVADPWRAAQEKAIDALPAKSDHFIFEERTYRVICGAEWQHIGPSQRYQMIPCFEAHNLIKKMMAVPAVPNDQKTALQDVAALLQDLKFGSIEKGLLLLRLIPVSIGRPATVEAAITPSQLAALRNKGDSVEDKVHWIEIQLIDEEGHAVPDEPYVITTPDNQEETGTTDEYGFGRVDGIVAGLCKICFPNLDQDAWSKAG